ncbi:uncharacterized protein LOC143445224 [Clavelina lepadiformis]|uniref:uncharacterized protein LOC143445224 n=1 Tax=Clavelina lepadiformis TaxID=159417 RepID=UPI004042962F
MDIVRIQKTGTSYWIKMSPPAPLKSSASDQKGLPFSTTIGFFFHTSLSMYLRSLRLATSSIVFTSPKDCHWCAFLLYKLGLINEPFLSAMATRNWVLAQDGVSFPIH